MKDNARKLYDALSQEYDLGTYEQFSSDIQDEAKRKKLYDATSEEYDYGDYNSFSSQLGFGGTASTAQSEVKEEGPEKLRGFWANFKESSKGLWAGLKGYAGEQLNVFTGSSREEQAALNDINELEAQGLDPVQYIADKEDAQFEGMYGMSKADFLALDKKTRKDLVRQYNSSNAGIQFVSPDKLGQMEREQVNQQAVQEAFQKALELAGGDYVKAKAILKDQAEDKTLGDALLEDASETLSNLRQSEGFAGWLGNLAPQMIPSATALALNWVTKGRAANLSKWIGYGSMSGLTLSTAGMSMIEARNAGATNLEVWTTGIADGLIEIISEKIPFDRITGRVFSSAKAKLADGLADAVSSPKGRKELEELLVRANEKLGGKLFSKKNVGDWLLDTAYEAGGEFFAEALQTITPMIYENPEDYPTLAEVLANGWEGAKAGLVMGSVLGGASKGLEHSMNKERRQQQGYVDVAQIENENGDIEVVEVVGLDPTTGKVSVLHDGELEQYDADKIGDTFRFSYEEFENARLMQLEDESIDQGTVNSGQVEGMRETVAKDIEELRRLDPNLSDESIEDLRTGRIVPEKGTTIADAVKKLQEDSARLVDLENAKTQEREAKKATTRQNIEQSVGQQFWITEENNKDINGNITYSQSVEEIVYADGRIGYVVGYDDLGNLAMVYTDGTKGFTSREEIVNQMNSGEVVSDTPMGLDAYLDSKVDQENAAAEHSRMSEEYELNVQEMMATHPQGSTINLGTEEAKIEVPIIAPPTKDGVIVQMPDGTTPMLRWEDVAHAEKKEIKPRTDAQNEQSIVDQYKVAYTSPVRTQDQASIAERDEVIKKTTPANPLPTKADGSVDQTALWNTDPVRWAQWNDEQRQDGGANSLGYINGAIAKESAALAEMQAAYEAESDFDARDAMEAEINKKKGRLNQLTTLQNQYVAAQQAAAAPQVAQQDQATEQTASTEETQAAQAEIKPRERSVESEVARLYDLGLSDEEVVANLDAKVAKAQKTLDAQSKKTPKMGADENAYIAKKREHQQKMQELQQELDFATAASKAVNETLAQRSQAPEAPGTVAMEKDPEPQNAVEFAARELGLKEGGIKLQRQSFSKHTGYGTAEMKKFFGLFKSKQDGGMTIEQAGETLMEMDRENNTGFFDQNDPNAGMDAILDALGAVNTIGELRSYVARQRQAEAQKEADAAYSAMMADYEETFGESMEETAHYNLMMADELLRGKSLSEDEFNELNSKFAEEQNQYETRIDQRETEPVPGAEDSGDLRTAESGIRGGSEEGDSVLQDEQSVRFTREGVPEEQNEPYGDSFNKQDADASVPSGESTTATAVESSLDEDMPDFTNSASAYFPSEEMTQKFSTMRARINDWAQKLGVQVRIMETLDDVVNQSARGQILKGREVYGYFDPATGEVAFYLPDFLSLHGRELTEKEFLSEIDKTYIHEVVAHRGLRGLLGEEKYGELCDIVWDAMTEQQKAKFLNYPGVNGNTRTAADEFIAHFAENVDYNDNRTLWDKIVDFIKDFFNSVELPEGISNESLAELLRHSYTNLAKSAAAIDTNANKQAEGNTVLRAANGSLVGMHNISEDKLRKVIKQGGLANPSTAVVNIAEYLLDGYGEISLIMPSSLVDVNTGDNIGTYTGDAWTPTYPPISRKVDNIGWKVIKGLIRSVVSEDSPLYHDIINGLENYLEDNRSSKMEFVFLKEKGIEPEIAYKGADGFVGIRNLEAVLGVQGLRDGMESYERYKNASPMAKRSFNMWLDAAGNMQAHKELKEQIKKEPRLAEVLKLNEDVSFAAFDSFTYDIFRKEQDAGKIDTYETMGAAARYVDANNLRGEFEAWLESLMEQAGAKEVFFAGYTRDGDRIYKDNTLENVSRHMRLQGRTNAYDNHGLSATKSALLQRLTSLSQIRKNKGRLQNEATYNKEYDVLKDRLWSIISQLADMQEISSNQFMNVDYAESRLQEAITKRNPIAHLNKEYGYDIDPAGEYADEIKSFIKDVQQMPAKYFETKFERPVYLNEFAAAVMPTTTSEDIKQAVSEAGLPIFEYDSAVEGSRREATLKATEDEKIRFRAVTPEMDAEYIEAVKSGDLETAQRMVDEAADMVMKNSKVRDSHGKLIRVTHYSPNEFTSFDTQKIGSSTDWGVFGRGFYFSNKDHRLYGKNRYEGYLNLENPFIINGTEEAYAYKEAIADFAGVQYYEVGKKETDDYTDYLISQGYDGVIYNDTFSGFNEYVAFYPYQFKLADVVDVETKDDNGNLIPLSERFNPESEDIRFRMRGENESAMDFTQSVVDEYKSQFNELGELQVVPVNEETAERFGLTLEQLKKKDGHFDPETQIISIFANEDNVDSFEVENTIFHEDIHFIADFYPHMDKLGQWMWENASSNKGFSQLKEAIEISADESEYHQEMLTNMVSVMLSMGATAEFEQLIPEDYRSIVKHIENEIGYDRQAEASRRENRRNSRNTEGATTPSVRNEKDSQTSGSESLTAEERRIINEYFPGAFEIKDNEFAEDNDIRYRVTSDVNTNPTEAQKKAGNYKMGHIRLDGYNITIENPKGSVRRGTDSKGNAWENTLNNNYGYIRGTEGVDGDQIDVYLSDNPTEGNVFVIDQVNPETREFDEHKVMYGFNSAEEAREAYLANFNEGWNGLGTITEVSKDEFKKWIESSHRKTKPFIEYKSVKVIGAQSEGEEIEDYLLPSSGTPTDEVVTNGLDLTPAQTAELAGNIFAALPEESRKKITDSLNGNLLGLQDAIMQIPVDLAIKENWNEEDREMADVVAEQMTKAVGKAMTRPFSAPEALWTLYNAVNKETDLVSEASRALVRRNLGFGPETLEMENQAREDVRFRTVNNASLNASTNMYNKGARNARTRLKESFVDMNASVEELVKSIEKASGKKAQGFENVLLALNQQSSKGLAAMESYEQKFLKPMFDEIIDIMKRTGAKYETVVRYVILKHGLERNKKLAQRDAKAHYQEIYDDIIAKINSMTDAQKRTYLTNAQLQEADAKAELARLKAIDQSALSAEDKQNLKKEIKKAAKAVAEAEEHLKKAKKIQSMSEQEALDELQKIFDKIGNGSDSYYQELRENDYSGLTSMFYSQLGVDRKDYETEEEYQEALMAAKQDKYSTLADVEAAAEAEVADFENLTSTKELWKRINAATKETLRQQYQANMISKDQYENLRDMFEFYVPLRGFADNTAEDMYTYYRKPNTSGYTKPILGAEGRKTEAESPFGWIAAMAGSAIASNVKNEAKLALYYFVSNRPDNGVATISRTWFVQTGFDADGKKIFMPAYPEFDESLSSEEAKQKLEDWQENMRKLRDQGQAYESGQRLNLGNTVVNIDDKNKPEHIVTVKVAGKDYTIIINGNPRAAQAINGDLNVETDSDYQSIFGPVLRWMSSVNTSYNPEFWATNMMRDIAFTFMSVNIKEDAAYRRRFAKNYAKAFKVVKMVYQNEKGTIGDSYLEDMYKEFVANGGVTGYTQIKDSEEWENEIKKYMESNNSEEKLMGIAGKKMMNGLHYLHQFGESLEQVSRFAAFLTSREMGKSMNEAINDAKEITVNFNRKGSGKRITLEEARHLTNSKGQPLNKFQQLLVSGLSYISPLGRRFFMFFNASIQGLNATYKLWKKNKTRAIGWALGYAAVGLMNALIHALVDDDDDYLDIPQYERRNSLMLGGNGVYFKWALPQEARAFYALGDLAVETVMGRNPHQNAVSEAAKIMTEILPVNPAEGWKAFIPSAILPGVELLMNEDYKGAPIYNEQKWLSKEEEERTARWAKAYQGTGKLYIWTAQALNYITGGDEYNAGLVNLQPEKIEHIVQSAFGGTIRTADKFVNTVMATIDPDEEVTVRQLPFLNRFLTINDERFKNVHVNDVYDYYAAEAEHAITLGKKYTKAKDKEAYDKLLKSDEYKWAQIYTKYKKPIKKYQDAIKVADTPAERMELMKQQDELKKRMIKEISEL